MLKLSIFLENVKQSKILLNKLNIDPNTSDEYKKIRNLLVGNDGYTYCFCKNHFVDGVPLEELENILNIIKNERGTINKFTKPIVKLKNIEEFYDEYNLIKNKSSLTKLYNKFLPEQKNLLDINNQDDIELLVSLNNKNTDNFFIKSKRYHTRRELINAINIFINADTETMFGSLLDKLEDDNINIITYSKEHDIIIILVNYKELVKWAGDTSWCILNSEYTFNSYNSEPFSQQFIMFLTDKNNNYSKIGVTTNITGYKTSHLKDDAFFSEKQLKDLLEEKEIDFKILLPLKENILKLNDFSPFPVKVLLDIGISKEEIIERKKTFNVNYAKDLQYFTKEEIRKWDLLEKTELRVDDLKNFSKEDIINKKIIDRINDKKIFIHLINAGFSKDEILNLFFNKINFCLEDLKYLSKNDIIKYKILEESPYITLNKLAYYANSFTYEDLKEFAIKKIKSDRFNTDDDKILCLIIYNKNREELLKKLIKSVWVEDLLPKQSQISIGFNRREHIKLDLVEIGRFTSNEIPFDFLYDTYRSVNRDSTNNNVSDKVISYTNFFEKKGYILTEKQLNRIIQDNFSNSILLYEYSVLLSKDFKKEFIINKINSLLSNNSRSLDYEFNIDLEHIKLIKQNLSKYEELYDMIFNKVKKNLEKRPHNLKIGDSYNGIDTEKTISYINFFNIKLSLEQLTEVFYGSDDFEKVLKYLRGQSLELSGEDGFKFFHKISKNNLEHNILIFCIKNGIYVDGCYKLLDTYLFSQTKKLSKLQIDKIEVVFNKRKEYKERWTKFIELDKINEALEETLNLSKKDEEIKKMYNYWYTNYFPILNNKDWNEINNRTGYKDHFISVCILLVKINKLDEFVFINDGIINSLKIFSKIICDKYIINWRRVFIILKKPEREILYKWLINNVKDIPTEMYKNIAPSMYLFDNDKFWRYVDFLTKNKRNQQVITYSKGETKTIYRTNRMYPLKGTIVYLTEEGKWDDLKKLFEIFDNLKMTKQENKLTNDIFAFMSFFYSRDNENDIFTKGLDKTNEKILKELRSNYFYYNPIIKNENFITNFKNFYIR